MSGVDWSFYHYGPYAFEIDDVLGDLALDIPQESVKTARGHAAIVFRAGYNLQSRLGEYVETQELNLVRRVIQKWGEVELNSLLDHVYFNTEPMKNAKRGEILDFSTIHRRTVQRRSRDITQVAPERLADFRARFKETMTNRAPRPLNPSPRFDEVYQDALTRMNQEESYEIPSGELNISGEAKTRIREQWDWEVIG